MKITSAELSAGPLAETTAGSFFVKEKNRLLYGLLIVFFTGCCAYFFGSILQQNASALTAVIFTAIFFCIGVLHVFLFPQWIPAADLQVLSRNLIYAVAMAISISLVSGIVFWVNHFQLKIVWLVAGIAFLLPVLVMECFRIFITLPVAQYQPWYPSLHRAPEKKMSLLLNSTLFKIHVLVKTTDIRPMVFNITLPAKLSVDAVFHHFFYDHRETMDLYENNQPYGWNFFIKTWYGFKAIDPHLSLAENGIKEDVVIYAKRAAVANQ